VVQGNEEAINQKPQQPCAFAITYPKGHLSSRRSCTSEDSTRRGPEPLEAEARPDQRLAKEALGGLRRALSRKSMVWRRCSKCVDSIVSVYPIKAWGDAMVGAMLIMRAETSMRCLAVATNDAQIPAIATWRRHGI
jgi:hypothetical protein